MKNPLEDFATRRGFYFRDNYRRLVLVAFIELTIVLALMGWIVFDLYQEPQGKHYVTTIAGDLYELPAANSQSAAKLARPKILQSDY